MVRVPARIYHYGYVRPPELMAVKKRVQDSIHRGRELSIAEASGRPVTPFDYGPLGELPRFKGTHPSVMREFIQRHHWRDQLDQGKRTSAYVVRHKHERFRYRLLSWFERRFTDNCEIFGWKNYKIVRPRPRLTVGSGEVVSAPVHDSPLNPAEAMRKRIHPGPK